MLDRLKRTRAGNSLYLLSQRRVMGWPLRKLFRFVQSEVFQPAHLFPVNIAHNRRQRATLKRFEAGLD
jgi:hypothetical protein